MSRTRQFLSTALASGLLLLVAGPAFAGPSPLEESGTSGGGGGPASVPSSGGASIWTYIGYAAAVLVVIGLVAVASTLLSRHAHQHAPHPA
jgi:hypothetical protein